MFALVCQCGEHEELPEVLLDNIYPVNVNVLFKHVFHKRCFWSKVLELRGAKGWFELSLFWCKFIAFLNNF